MLHDLDVTALLRQPLRASMSINKVQCSRAALDQRRDQVAAHKTCCPVDQHAASHVNCHEAPLRG